MRGILRGVARSRALRAFGVGVAIAAVLPWTAAEPIAAATSSEATSRPWMATSPWLASYDLRDFALADSEEPPEISVEDAEVSEGDDGLSHLNFEVTLDHSSTQTVTAHFATEEGSADASDYVVEMAGTVSFAPLEVSRVVSVKVKGDEFDELHEGLDLLLSDPTNASIADGVARGLILNDDGNCTYDQALKTVHLPVEAERILFVEDGWINADSASCGTADVTNTNTISVTGGNGPDSLVIDLRGGERFSPGSTGEPSGPEIDIVVSLLGGGDSVIVSGSEGADDFVVGSDGINLNPGDETDDSDADVSIVGALDSLTLNGNGGADSISGSGGAGTGDPSMRSLTFSGNDGDDSLTGGSGADAIFGGDGDDDLDGGGGIDTVDFSGTEVGVEVDLAAGTAAGAGSDMLTGIENATGGSNDDVLAGSSGVNVLDGGIGDDTADFTSSAAGVTVKLLAGTATGDGSDLLEGIENVIGSAHVDSIVGDELTNRLEGGGGADSVSGGEGDDELRMQDAEADTQISCGEGNHDLAETDAGLDVPDPDCETLDERGPAVGFGHDQTADEGDSVAFSVGLSRASAETVTVRVQTAAAHGTEAEDFTAVDQILTFAPGELSQDVPVATSEDPIDEPNEGFIVTLSSPAGATIDAGETTGTITDDDLAPTASIAAAQAEEGEPVNFAVTLSNPSESAVTVGASTIGGGTASAGGDYATVPDQTLTFAPLAISGGFEVATVEDRRVETNETFDAALSGANTATATILDDDSSPVVAGQAVTTSEDTEITITLGTANDADGDLVTYDVLDQPDHGVLSAIAGNQVTYTPHANVHDADDFAVQGSDGPNDSGSATVSITVNAVNDAPVAHSQLGVSTPYASSVAITLTGFDVDNTSLTFAILTQPSKGSLLGTPPSLVYAPRAGETGNDSFTFKTNDGTADSSPATVTIAIGAAPPPPPPPPPPPSPPPARARHGLTVARSGTGVGTIRSTGIACGADCTEEYEAGTAVTLVALPAKGSRFTGWAGACSGSALACTLAMDAAKAVTAKFTKTVLRTAKFKPVKMCHKGRTITVRSKRDLSKHLKHKDKRGACNPKRAKKNRK